MILVTGAAGKTGRAVCQKLAAKGHAVRGLVRRPEQVAALQRLGVLEIVVVDMGDRIKMQEAVEGVTAIYHICPNMHPDEISIGEKVIQSAKAVGIERFVYHSVLHPQIETMAHHWQKMRVEEMLFASRLSYTILQPAAYMQNVLANWDRIVEMGVYAVPYALETRLSMVDLQDVAEVASIVLTEEGHAGATYELSGMELLSQDEIAQILGRQVNQEVKGEVIPLNEWEDRSRSAGMSDYAVNTLVAMFEYYEQYNFWGSSQVLTWLLGRPPTPFTVFLDRILSSLGIDAIIGDQ